MKAQHLTLPNALSGLRLLLVPIIAWFIAQEQHDALAFALLAIAGATDWLDGFLARRWNQITRLGTLLDPLADRIAIIAFLCALSARNAVPWVITILIIARDALLACLLPVLRRHGQWALPVTKIGKLGTCVLLMSIPLSFLVHSHNWTGWKAAMQICMATGTAIYWLAGIDYLRQLGQLLSQGRGSA